MIMVTCTYSFATESGTQKHNLINYYTYSKRVRIHICNGKKYGTDFYQNIVKSSNQKDRMGATEWKYLVFTQEKFHVLFHDI